MTTLEDIRVGDIMLCPNGAERKIEQCNGIFAHVGDDRWFNKSDLRNPELRVGDAVRIRGGNPMEWFPWNGKLARPDHCYAMVARAPVAEKQQPLIMHPWKPAPGVWLRTADAHGKIHTLARVEQVARPNGPYWVAHFDGEPQGSASTPHEAQAYADKWLAREGWVEEGAPRHRTIAEYLLDPNTKTNTPRCTLCGHANPRHYASCEHNPEPKGTLISTLGWAQPQPIVVLCQNEEDVP